VRGFSVLLADGKFGWSNTQGSGQFTHGLRPGVAPCIGLELDDGDAANTRALGKLGLAQGLPQAEVAKALPE